MAVTQSVSLSDRGRRSNNEDFAAYYEPTNPEELERNGCLYIVADGVGGAARGERASQYAAQKTLYEYYQQPAGDPGEDLRQILRRINADIHSFAEENNTRMATTMVAAVVRGGLLYLANVGDSRAYLIRDGQVTQLNRDHSIVGEMMAHGEMTEAEAMASKIKNRLTRSLGGDPDVHVDVYPALPLKPGDKILLCSDGLTRYALQGDILKMTYEGSLQEIVRRLVQFANQRGGADNTSVVAVMYQGAEMLEPAIPAARPSRVDVETAFTQPDGPVFDKKQRNEVATLSTLAMLTIVMFFVTGLMFIKNWNRIAPALGLVGAPTPTIVVVAEASPTQGIDQLSVTVSPSLTEISVVTQTLAGTDTSVLSTISPDAMSIPTLALTPTLTLTPGLIPTGSYFCVGDVRPNDSLSIVFNRFGKNYSDYLSHSKCTLDMQLTMCERTLTIPPPYVVYTGEWVVVPGVTMDNCTTKGGKWVKQP